MSLDTRLLAAVSTEHHNFKTFIYGYLKVYMDSISIIFNT